MKYKILQIWIITAFLLGAVFFAPVPAKAAGENCFCATDLAKATAQTVNDPSLVKAQCFTVATIEECKSKAKEVGVPQCYWSNPGDCAGTKLNWELSRDAKILAAAEEPPFSSESEIIPSCLFKDVLPANCRDVSVFIEVLIRFARILLFPIIGSLALLYFIYGGFIMILSAGNPEKVKQGTDAMVAAAIGLVIVFAAYVLVQFLGQTVQLKSDFQLK